MAVVRRVNLAMHYVAGATLVALMLLVVADIVGRRFFGRPLRGTVEIVEMAMVLIIYLGLGYAEHEGDHVSLDLVYNRLGARTRSALSVITGVFGLGVMGLVAWQLWEFAGVLRAGQYTTGVLRIPQAPIAIVAVAGAGLFILAMATNVVAAIRAARRGPGPQDDRR